MPRVYRKPDEVERVLIRDFLQQLQYRISDPIWQDRPDALVTIASEGLKKRVAIELTDYFTDTAPGTMSPLSPVADFWKLVQASLVRRISHRKHLTGLTVRVHLLRIAHRPYSRKDSVPRARRLAAELVDFVENHPVDVNSHTDWSSRDFDDYAEIRSRIDRIWVSRWTNEAVFASRCSWVCDNLAAGFVRLKLDYIKSAIKRKNEKAKKYPNWGNASEKWLLISASGINVSNRAGPSSQDVDWADSELCALCQDSPFDKIVFWESFGYWHKWMKPNEELVRL